MTLPVRTSLWTKGDLLAAGTVNALAFLGVLVCWIGSATEVRWHPGLYWLQGAIVAAVVAAVADASWLLSGMRQLRQRRRLLAQCWPAVTARVATTQDPLPGGTFVTADRMTTYHKPSCLLVRGKQVREYSRDALGAQDPCGMCAP